METIPVLLADNNPAALRITSHFLREYYQDEVTIVGMSSGTNELVSEIQSTKPRIVVVGVDMCEPANLNLLRRLRSAAPNLGIIALGSLDLANCCEEARQAGADSYVAKAALHKELLPAIRQLAGRTYAHNEVSFSGFFEISQALVAA